MNNTQQTLTELKLFMVLLGSKAPGRHVEQHDFFFGIAAALPELVAGIEAFWPEAAGTIHIDGWREVTAVDGYHVRIQPQSAAQSAASKKLFFINLGGYLENRFEEQHFTVLTVKENRAEAFKEAKSTLFFQHNYFEGTHAHIDDKYGIDVDDLYEIDDILSAEQKQKYRVELTPAAGLPADKLRLGYFKLHNL